ncbi:MAG: hypothetical protein AAB481_01195 [Patescibacteria group bacterium]
MSRDHIHERLGGRNIRTLLGFIMSLLVVVGVWIGWKFLLVFPEERTTFVSSIDPVEISSWDAKRHTLTIFSISSDVFVDGVFGVGSLPVASLSRLETMDKTKKGLLAGSVAEAFGTPILPNDMPPLLRLRWAITLRSIRPDAVTRIDLKSLGAYRLVTLPDGTSAQTFDTNRFDAAIGSTLEFDSIRSEGLRVRVINTTNVAGLGTGAARVFSHAGMVVVMVESETPALKACTVTVKKSLWDSKSVSFIKTFFNCSVGSGFDDEQAELTIRLGQEYAGRFLPQ